MLVKEFKIVKSQKVSQFLNESFMHLSYNSIQKLLRQKDIKVNNKRIKDDILLKVGDFLVVYYSESQDFKINIIYEDENIIVVNKPRKIETISESGDVDLLFHVNDYLKFKVFAVHRLDRNTEGLVIFAKNSQSKKSLDGAIKLRKIQKFYLALVNGFLSKKQDNMIAYLKKDETNSKVNVIDSFHNGYEKIQTNYCVLKEFDDCSLVEVELVTGKTHQIRAHFSHVGNFIIGDEKYGDSKINRKFKSKFQNLCAYKIIFNFEENDFLSYLNNKIIEINKNEIKFCQKL